jgi:hypothetical protein
MKLFGVDFSGNAKQWRPRCSRPNVWVATATLSDQAVTIQSVAPVADLPGEGEPFDNLAMLLSITDNAFAAIDAPFSVPVELSSDAEELWARVSRLPKEGRPFPKGADLIEMLLPAFAPRGKKLYRETEKYWLGQGVNTRSTVWVKPRGGAPFAAVCMFLLSQHNGSVWPIKAKSNSSCTLVEAFPAAQLKHWKLPSSGYSKADAVSVQTRKEILSWMTAHRQLEISEDNQELCVRSPDALDSVICVYSAAAVARGQNNIPVGGFSSAEGFISIHD